MAEKWYYKMSNGALQGNALEHRYTLPANTRFSNSCEAPANHIVPYIHQSVYVLKSRVVPLDVELWSVKQMAGKHQSTPRT